MKILITGNMGYVGPVVVQQLRQSFPDANLVGFDMGYFGHCLTSNKILPECRVDTQYFGDVRTFPPKLLDDVQAVVQLAAISNDPMGKRYEQVTYDVNYRASVRLAQMAKEAGVHSFIFPSSCSVYGSSDGQAKTEDSGVDPLTAYAKSKIMTERELEPLADQSFTVTCLRFSTACGLSERLRLDLVLNDFIASAIAEKAINVLSDGTPWRPLIHVKDMARAVEWAIQRKAGGGQEFLTVNVGSDEWNYQVKDLADAVANCISGAGVSINKDAQPDKRSYRVSFKRFKELAPDHQPQMTLVGAIPELRKALEEMEFKDKNFRDSYLVRFTVLKRLQGQGFLTEALEWIRD
jgi:nucleoside-diphosphate-sugar epimerase